MKLARFSRQSATHIGKVVGAEIVDLTPVTGPSASMRTVLQRLPSLRHAIETETATRFALADVTLEAPINDPQKFLAIGMNYQKHAEEAQAAGIPIPTSQLWFNKQVSCITGPCHPIVYPSVSEKLDYEIELAVVIGTRCRHVAKAQARAVIAGYMVANDVSARDWQQRSPTFTLGKSFDTHGPIGPWITTDDEIADPHALEMRLSVNGEERQRSSTADMIYNIYDQIAYLSMVMTLEPGDILSTGTPSGVGLATGKFLAIGDEIEASIGSLGIIRNKVVPDKT